MSSAVTAMTRGTIRVISLNRPESYNAMNFELMSQLSAELTSAADPAIRTVILRGEGKAFCAGGDVKAFQTHLETGRVPLEMPETLHRSIAQIRSLPKPVIAAVQGACAGAGMSLALACDLTIASDDAVFTMAYSAIGLSADGGSTYFLPRLVGLKKALELCFLSERLSAETALQLGLLNRIVPAADLTRTVDSLADLLAQGPTAAYARTKFLLNESAHRDLGTQLDAETLGIGLISQTKDFKEGVTAFVEKRRPHFTGV